MADNKQKPSDNLIDLASERQRLRQQRSSQTLPPKGKKLTRSSRAPEAGQSSIRWHHYLQLVLFLLLFSYFIQRCKGG
jgi:hypothetical protein